MKSIKLLICFLPLLLSQQSYALIAYGDVQAMVCTQHFAENGIAFVGEYLQRIDVSETTPSGQEIVRYLAQYKVVDLWCNDVRTEFTPVDGAPEWATSVQNTETEVWVAVSPLGNMWVEPAPNQRQFVSAWVTYDAIYYTSNAQGSLSSFSSGPFNISDDNMVTGNLTSYQEVQTLSLDDFRDALSECSSCGTSGIDDNPIQVEIYPNPARESITIATNELAQNASYKIYGVDGKLVLSGQVNSNGKIDTSSLITGLYFVFVSDSNGNSGVSEFLRE